MRAGIALTTALITGAVADISTEFAENLGLLGGSVRDVTHQAVLPAFLIGLAVGVALATFVVFSRITAGDPLLHCMSGVRARIVDLTTALAGSALVTIVMEGYETRFGGLSPFDPGSVVCAHAPALLAAFLVVAPIARGAINAALRVASSMGECASNVVAQFLRRVLRARVPPGAVHTSTFTLRCLHLPPEIAGGACGRRAPPSSISYCFVM